MRKISAHLGLLIVVGRIGLLGLWFLASIIIVRKLPQTEFAKYVFCMTVVKMFTSFINDTMDMAVLRRVPVLLNEDRLHAIALWRASLWMRLIAAGATATLMAAAFPWIRESIGGGWPAVILLALTVFAVVGDVLTRSALVFLQASSSFVRFMAVEGSLQISRFALIALLVFTHKLSAQSALVAYASLSIGAFCLALILMPRDIFAKTPSAKHEVTDSLKYSLWVVIAFGVAAVSERVEIFGVGYFSTPEALATYGAALILASIPEFLEGAVNTIVMPRVSEAQKNGQFPQMHAWYLKRSIIPCALVILLVILLGDWLTVTFLSAKYASAIPLLKILIAGAMVWLAVAPIPSALVAFASPSAMLRINVGGLILRTIAGLLLIPRFGVIGAGMIFLGIKIGMTIAITLTAYAINRRIQSGEMSIPPEAPTDDVAIAGGVSP